MAATQDIKSVGNPLKNDPELVDLMDKLEVVNDYDGFESWRSGFLKRFDQFLGEKQSKKAQNAYESFRTDRMEVVVKNVGKISAHVEKGDLSTSRVSVRARNAMGETSKQLKKAVVDVRNLAPSTSLDESREGYTKYHLGAVLIRDGFQEYERLNACNDILKALKEKCLDEIGDSNLLESIAQYETELNRFVALMEDLGLYKILIKYREVTPTDENGKPKAPKPKPAAAAAAATETTVQAQEPPTPKKQQAAQPTQSTPKEKTPKRKSYVVEGNWGEISSPLTGSKAGLRASLSKISDGDGSKSRTPRSSVTAGSDGSVNLTNSAAKKMDNSGWSSVKPKNRLSQIQAPNLNDDDGDNGKAKREAEEKAKREAEEKAKREAEEKAKREAEEKAKREAEEKAKREAEEKSRKEAEENAKRDAEEKARKEAEENAKKEAEEKARKEAEEKAKIKEAEERAKREAEEKAQQGEAEEKAAKLKAEEDKAKAARLAAMKPPPSPMRKIDNSGWNKVAAKPKHNQAIEKNKEKEKKKRKSVNKLPKGSDHTTSSAKTTKVKQRGKLETKTENSGWAMPLDATGKADPSKVWSRAREPTKIEKEEKSSNNKNADSGATNSVVPKQNDSNEPKNDVDDNNNGNNDENNNKNMPPPGQGGAGGDDDEPQQEASTSLPSLPLLDHDDDDDDDKNIDDNEQGDNEDEDDDNGNENVTDNDGGDNDEDANGADDGDGGDSEEDANGADDGDGGDNDDDANGTDDDDNDGTVGDNDNDGNDDDENDNNLDDNEALGSVPPPSSNDKPPPPLEEAKTKETINGPFVANNAPTPRSNNLNNARPRTPPPEEVEEIIEEPVEYDSEYEELTVNSETFHNAQPATPVTNVPYNLTSGAWSPWVRSPAQSFGGGGGLPPPIRAYCFCGVDDSVDPRLLAILSYCYPLSEFAVLFRPDMAGQPRYASLEWVQQLSNVASKSNGGMKLAAHLCGSNVNQVLDGDDSFVSKLPDMHFKRVQINATAINGVNTYRLGKKVDSLLHVITDHPEMEFIIQRNEETRPLWEGILLSGKMPPNLTMLLDESKGQGIMPTSLVLPPKEYLVGYAGGIGLGGREHVKRSLHDIIRTALGKTVWVSMESSLRCTKNGKDVFDINRCYQVLEVACELGVNEHPGFIGR